MVRKPGALAEFLRARRALVRPEQVGLVPGAARQVPGLRREEVATLAGVSTDYYVHLEQGREKRPSTQILDALARVLQLDYDTHTYLRALAGPDRPVWRTDQDLGNTHRTHRALAGLLQQITAPAMLVTPWLEVTARNKPADALYDGLPLRDNLARMAFLDDAVTRFVEDPDQLAQCTVATLRAAAGPPPHTPQMIELIEELSLRSDRFRQLWARHDIHRKGSAVKHFHHPTAGRLTLHQHVMTLPDHPELQLWIYQAEPGSDSEHAL
ncbi:helix-turn-helix domain-containing protein [Amycolatopsis cihanbeyliensis]|uniref:Helix-turn-helix protein n=1 Tax=Amycolatopsis cihanbeyliensis TaxID=1128664 RepID=A0A542DQ66_AMYCI|nr:helix-turn-helix transcriptional regulator [Amycolatopsis cihanbeyliensis]TQJ05207.1 helix-turn-helix protein [Amycolatopsis cihanbeyliensis]